MPAKNDAWGIEVGANAIKALHLVRDGDELEVRNYEVLPFRKVLTTPDLDVEEAIQVGLDQLMNRHDLGRSTVVASVPGHMAFARFAKLPPVDPKELPKIVKFEAVQQIPFPLDQVQWDYQVFQKEDSPAVQVGIFAITKNRVSKLLVNYERVGIRIDALTLSPLGVYNGLAHDLELQENSPGTVFIDISTSSTDVIIVEAGGIWLRTLPIGGNNFTEALVKAFKLTFPKAEKLKKEAGTSKYARQIFQAMRPVFADLVQEIQRSLGYYQSLHREAELKRLVGVGSTFRLPGLTKFLKQQLQIDVKRLDTFKRISMEGRKAAEFANHALNLGTVYGLALQGLGLERVTANILPTAITKQRMWRAKQPMFAAAAAVVVAAVAVGQFHLMAQQAAHEGARKRAQNDVRPVLSAAQTQVSELNSLNAGGDPWDRLNNYRRIFDYRDLWPKMIEDLSLANAALDSQPELLAEVPDYEKIEQIPREQRKRLHLKWYNVAYWPEGKDPTKVEKRGATRFYSDTEEEEEEAKPQPRFKITAELSTTYAKYLPLLDEFTAALKKTQLEYNRPYRIVEVTLGKSFKLGVGDVGAGGGFGARGNMGNEMAERMGMSQGMQGPAGYGMRKSGGSGPAKFAVYLPAPPEAYKLSDQDYYQHVEWIIELLKPEEARQREDPQWRPADKDAAGDTADATTRTESEDRS